MMTRELPPRPLRSYIESVRSLCEEINREATNNGLGIGELVHAFTDYFHIEQCPRCQRWQRWLDQIRLHPNGIEWHKITSIAKDRNRRIVIEWLDGNGKTT